MDVVVFEVSFRNGYLLVSNPGQTFLASATSTSGWSRMLAKMVHAKTDSCVRQLSLQKAAIMSGVFSVSFFETSGILVELMTSKQYDPVLLPAAPRQKVTRGMEVREERKEKGDKYRSRIQSIQ